MPASRFRLPAEILKDSRGLYKRSSSFFILRARPNGLKHPRFAAIVGAKVDRRSSVRNKLKRRIREFLRTKPDPRDLIVTVLPPAAKAPQKTFMKELEQILS